MCSDHNPPGTADGGNNLRSWTTAGTPPASPRSPCGDRCTARSDAYLNGASVSVPCAAKSVQTLQVDGVTV